MGPYRVEAGPRAEAYSAETETALVGALLYVTASSKLTRIQGLAWGKAGPKAVYGPFGPCKGL